jgi:acetyltransferase
MMKLSHRVAHERLRRICFIDYNRELALVVDYQNPTTGVHEILAVGRLTKVRGAHEAEFAVVVSDAYQGKGIGNQLLRRLIEAARGEKLRRIFAEILSENIEIQRLIVKLGFHLECAIPGQLVKADLVLG